MSTQPSKKTLAPISQQSSKTDEVTSRSSLPAIPLAAVIISGFALTGAIFLWLLRNAGHAYRLGYLLGFGFQPDALPWSADDLIYLGYYAQEDYLVPLLGLFVVFAVLLAVVFFAGNFVKHRAALKQATKPVTVNGGESINLVTTEVMFFWVAAIVIFVLLMCSVVPLGLLGPVRYRGENDAVKAMAAIRQWDLDEMKAHQMKFVEIVRDKAGLVSGVPISCTDKLCAIYSPVGPIHSHTVPLTDIISWSTIELENVPLNERGVQAH
ncbi:hypothetical protein [Paraburkholderia domus]|uniref:hypothetical protein n=1 Tax=Paraburkholderia domus TaxID=2793075 RepID=UPI001B0142AE|nr:hypothetical protein [Paraburkholderia domus]CAE6696273.1 hypothetical protein R75483_00607 [Paraburkholderia domus]